MVSKKISENIIYILLIFLGVSLIINVILSCIIFDGFLNPVKSDFSLLYPGISQYESDNFREIQKNLRVNYLPLKESIVVYFQSKNISDFGVYFEDLTTGSWIGINEKERFRVGSLMKVPVVANILNQVDNGKISMADELEVRSENLNPVSSPLYYKGSGYQLNISELIHYSLVYSDNTAISVLERNISQDDFMDTLSFMGISYSSIKDNFYYVSPKEYGNLLRSLYYSTYLKRKSSQYILNLLTKTYYNDGIPAGILKGTKVAHKIGYWFEGGFYMDCGIIYFKNPYMLCVMLKGTTEKESNEIISEVSEMAYNYSFRSSIS